MLLLSFDIGEEKYAIDTNNVIEITPLVNLKTVPGSLHSICGLLNYHGTSVPVVDINLLCDKSNKADTLTTRIIIVNYHDKHVIGIKADNVTETLRANEANFKSSGIQLKTNNFLGDISEHDNSFLQLVNIDQLLSDDVRNSLFPEDISALG